MNDYFKSLCSTDTIEKRRLADNEVKIRYKKYVITFSAALSRVLKQNNISRMNVRFDELTGQIDLVLSQEQGLPVTWCGTNLDNLVFNNKSAVVGIRESLGLQKHESFIVKMSRNLSKINGVFCFRIIPNEPPTERSLF